MVKMVNSVLYHTNLKCVFCNIFKSMGYHLLKIQLRMVSTMYIKAKFYKISKYISQHIPKNKPSIFQKQTKTTAWFWYEVQISRHYFHFFPLVEPKLNYEKILETAIMYTLFQIFSKKTYFHLKLCVPSCRTKIN